MPIRLNLLAEAQAAEEMRRRDPVKRAIWVGSLLVAMALAWAGYVYAQGLMVKHSLALVEKQISVRTNEYKAVMDNQKKADEIRKKLGALRQLATNRFLQGSLLNGLQHVSLDDVQLMRVKVDQLYTLTEEVKAKTNSEGRVTAGKPATITEGITLTLDAKDSTPKPGEPGDQVNPFKDAIATNAYFQSVLSRSNAVQLRNVSPLNVPPDGRPFRLFTLECNYPKQSR